MISTWRGKRDYVMGWIAYPYPPYNPAPIRVKYRVYYPEGKTLEVDAESYVIEEGWHKFETYLPNRFEPYWVHYSDDIKVERID